MNTSPFRTIFLLLSIFILGVLTGACLVLQLTSPELAPTTTIIHRREVERMGLIVPSPNPPPAQVFEL